MGNTCSNQVKMTEAKFKSQTTDQYTHVYIHTNTLKPVCIRKSGIQKAKENGVEIDNRHELR